MKLCISVVIVTTIISNVSKMFEENIQDEVNLPADISEVEQRQLELDLFRLSLPGSGRSSVGSTSLGSGITITLMDQVVQNAFFLTTVEEIESRLPIYSRLSKSMPNYSGTMMEITLFLSHLNK